ncbi:ribosome maturation factor RimP, partial [Mycolicibacterium insubricum]|nr:ribosome maturation factor RimP [Mycolicibacterium insubricum]
ADFAEAGYDVEDVLVVTGTSPRITVIADGDTPLDLDVIADLSDDASALLDEALAGGHPGLSAGGQLRGPGPAADRREAL